MIIALDVGTSSTRATTYNETGEPVPGAFHRVATDPLVTADGGVEHDPERLLEAVATCLDAVQARHRAPKIQAIGVATFWHGLLGFDSAGRPVTPIYSWADTRSAREAGLLASTLDEAAFHARTGCHLHSSYWPSKLRWLARERAADVRRVARWGSVGEYLELAFFGRAATSVSIASGTGLLDQETAQWDREALAVAGIDEAQLFALCDRTEPRIGLRPQWASRWPALRDTPLFPAVGDGAAANIGSNCSDPTRVALNVGTSAALRIVTQTPPAPPRGLWRYRLDRRASLLGGATSEGGNVYAWCRTVLRCAGEEEDEALAAAEPDAHGLTVLPFLAGERAPGWRGGRRAVIAGLSLNTRPNDILRAALEAVALRLTLVYELLRDEAAPDHTIIASGGALARSRIWAQIIADALGRPLGLLADEEATSRGAALLALDALGLAPKAREPRSFIGAVFEPDPARHARYRAALLRQRELDERV